MFISLSTAPPIDVNENIELYDLIFSLKFTESCPSLLKRFLRYGGGSLSGGRSIFPCLQHIPKEGDVVPLFEFNLSSHHSNALQYWHLYVGLPKFHGLLLALVEVLVLLLSPTLTLVLFLLVSLLARFSSLSSSALAFLNRLGASMFAFLLPSAVLVRFVLLEFRGCSFFLFVW